MVKLCPKCGAELTEEIDGYFCQECGENIAFDEDYGEPDYDSMVNNGDQICLNCTYWSVSPYGRAHGMYCRRGNGQPEPTDSCYDFVQSTSFASYGDEGQYQFNETGRNISNKLYNWRNSR